MPAPAPSPRRDPMLRQACPPGEGVQAFGVVGTGRPLGLSRLAAGAAGGVAGA